MAAKSVLNSSKEAAIDAGVAVVGGGLVGAVAGKFALLVGAPLAVYGYHKNSRWAKALGLGIMASTGYQTATGTAGLGETENYGVEGVEGFDFAAAKTGAVNRVTGWFTNFKTKVFMAPKSGTSGLGEGDSNYFGNPLQGQPDDYPMASLGAAAIDNQAQIVGLGNLGAGISGSGSII
jgi:hypothetical protein